MYIYCGVFLNHDLHIKSNCSVCLTAQKRLVLNLAKTTAFNRKEMQVHVYYIKDIRYEKYLHAYTAQILQIICTELIIWSNISLMIVFESNQLWKQISWFNIILDILVNGNTCKYFCIARNVWNMCINLYNTSIQHISLWGFFGHGIIWKHL